MRGKRIGEAISLAALLCACVFAQTTTGSLVGTVTDSSNAAVPGVNVELRNLTIGFVRTTTSGAEGIFRFNSLEPGNYDLTIKPPSGFKVYSQKAIAVSASANRDLGRIELTVGSLTETVSVTAAATPVQTASSANTKLIDPNQFSDITLKGRDLFGILVMLPGMSANEADMTSESSVGSVVINGGLTGGGTGTTNFAVDGITDMDTGSMGTTHFEPNMDSIAEMRVLATNYQAEYGRNSSGIAVVTKSGTQEFHGSGWVNKRHEMFNANSFFNNYNGVQKSVYRFFVWGYSVGGPVYIPKLFNTRKQKLFFFFSQEYTKQKPATQTGYYNMPTAAQRAGNFAGYTDGNGVAYPIYDPTTGNPAPNNNISGLILNAAGAQYGQGMLNFLPLPNVCGHSGVASSGCITDADPTKFYARNYYYQFNETHPRRNDTVRVDYNVSSKLTSWVRYINDFDLDDTNGNYAMKNAQGQWVAFSDYHPHPGHGYGVGVTYTISPSMVNEFTFGKSWNTSDWYAQDQSQLNRSTMGNPPSFKNFAADPNFIADQNLWRPSGLGPGSENFQVGDPFLSFGGGQEASEASYTSSMTSCVLPCTNWNNAYTASDSVSKVWGKHNFKAGLYFERTGKTEQDQLGAQYLGAYSFASSTAMSNNTQDGYANAFLGNFNSYTEAGRVVGDYWFMDIESFIQDNWRISKRLTLDLGVRFYHQVPSIDHSNQTTDWLGTAYNPAQAERLYLPSCLVSTASKACPTASQKAYDPVTKTTTFFALAGTLVPASAGGYTGTPTPFPGMVRAGQDPAVPNTLWNVPAVSPTFRLGVAWDVFGNGKTAVRAGFGQFLDLISTQTSQNSAGNPPDIITRSIYYSTVDQIPSFANSAAITPIAPPGTIGNQHIQGSYNGSFTIEQNVGFGTVVNVAYVFNLGKHLLIPRQLNAIAPYAEYNPANFNPNVAYLPANTSGKTLSDNYFRPLPGLGALTYVNFSGSTNYNSLQGTVRRNMTKHLSYGLAYTLSKLMRDTRNSPYFTDKFRDYGPSYSPARQVLAVNYVYEVPNLAQKLNFKPLGYVTDHWVVSGISQFRADVRVGVPGISFAGTTSSNPQMNWTGGYEGARMFVTGNPQLPAGQVSFAGATPFVQAAGANANGTPGNQILNMSAFTIPFPCSWTPAADPHQGVGQSMECYGNAGPGSIIPLPNTRLNNWDMTFTKNFPLKSERRVLMFRAEMYNIFNHTQFTGANTSPQYNWPNWQNGVLTQTNSSLGRYTAAANPRQMSMSLRFQF